MSHTKEPWKRPPNSKRKGSIRPAFDTKIIYGDDLIIDSTDFRRASECVNALAGIESPAAFLAAVDELLHFLEGKVIPQWPEIEMGAERVRQLRGQP